jgi:hypothetical protein
MLSMLGKEPSKRPSAAQVRAVARELRGAPHHVEWDQPTGPAPAPAFAPTSPASPLPVEASTTPMVSPLPRPATPPPTGVLRAAKLRWQAAALAGLGCAGMVVSAIAYKYAHPAQSHAEAAAVGRAVGGASAATTATGAADPAAVPDPAAADPAAAAAASPSGATAAAEPGAGSATDEAGKPRHEGTVLVHVDAPDARIEVDGRLIAQSASGARVRVEAGEHAVEVTAPGRHLYRSHIAVGADATVDVPVRLVKLGAPLRPAARPLPAHPGAAALGKAAANAPGKVGGPAAPASNGAGAGKEPASTLKTSTPPATPPAANPPKQKRDRNDPDYLVDPFGAPK